MNIQNHLILSQIHSTTPVKQGETTTATLKEKISDSKAVVIIRGQEYQAEFSNEIPQSEKVTIKVLNVSENKIQVESKETLRSSLNPQSNNSLQFIESGKILSNSKISDPISTIMNKKGLQPDIVIKNHIKEALSGNFDEPLHRINKNVFNAIHNEVRVTTNSIKIESNPETIVKQVIGTLNRIAPFINPQTIDELYSLAIEININLSQDKFQIVKERLISALQQVDADIQVIANKADRENILQVGSKLSDIHPKEVVSKTRELVQQLPNVTKVIEKTQEMLKSIHLKPKSIEKLDRAVQEAKQYQQLGKELSGKERIIQALQQIENELPEVSTSKTEPQLKEAVRQTREKVQQSPTVTKAIEKTQELIKSITVESKSIEKLERAIQEAKQYQQLGRGQAGKEKIVQTLQQIENELPDVSTSKTQPQLKETVRQMREQVQQSPTVTKAIEKTQELIKSIPVESKSIEKLERAIQEARQYQQLGREQQGKERIVQALRQIENDLPEIWKSRSELSPKELVRQTREQVRQTPTVTKAVEKTQALINSLPHAAKIVEKLEFALQIAKQYQQLGKEKEGKEKIIQALQQIESESSLMKNEKVNSKTEKITPQTDDLKQDHSKEIKTNTSESEKVTPMQNKSEITKQAVDQWMNMVQKQSKMGQALDLLQTEINKYPESIPVKKVMESMERAAQHVEAKKELAARKEIHETLQQIKPNLPSEAKENHEVQSINEEMKSYIENSPLLASAAKDIVVTKVTEKLAKATVDFKEVQKEIVRNLNNVDNMLRTQHTQPQARQLLESAIAKLDNSILKSEMMILSDMGTEKKLMQASSQLAEAKKMLSSGNSHEAQKIVQNVSKLLEKINWKPSEVKVMHYTNGLSDEQSVPHYEKQLTKTISNIANYSDMEYGSPREMYEKIRSIGLNYERDIGNYFASNKPEHQLKDLESNNLKYLLQKISSEDGTGKFAQQIEQTLSNITGQQLLSKSDHQANQQSMMFSLPVQLEQQMKNIKVFVNSKKDGQKVDWENCSLYFLIETPKLGEVGILVSSADRKLSLTLKNNSYDFEQVAKPIGEKAIQKIEEIGYQVNGMKFTNLRKESAQQQDRKEEQQQTDFAAYFTEKGMNFTI
jgi:hypothetical protein